MTININNNSFNSLENFFFGSAKEPVEEANLPKRKISSTDYKKSFQTYTTEELEKLLPKGQRYSNDLRHDDRSYSDSTFNKFFNFKKEVDVDENSISSNISEKSTPKTIVEADFKVKPKEDNPFGRGYIKKVNSVQTTNANQEKENSKSVNSTLENSSSYSDSFNAFLKKIEPKILKKETIESKIKFDDVKGKPKSANVNRVKQPVNIIAEASKKRKLTTAEEGPSYMKHTESSRLKKRPKTARNTYARFV